MLRQGVGLHMVPCLGLWLTGTSIKAAVGPDVLLQAWPVHTHRKADLQTAPAGSADCGDSPA